MDNKFIVLNTTNGATISGHPTAEAALAKAQKLNLQTGEHDSDQVTLESQSSERMYTVLIEPGTKKPYKGDPACPYRFQAIELPDGPRGPRKPLGSGMGSVMS